MPPQNNYITCLRMMGHCSFTQNFSYLSMEQISEVIPINMRITVWKEQREPVGLSDTRLRPITWDQRARRTLRQMSSMHR